mmetsp:Transcript_59707/g.174596  ORF Transcript_59707/g.174596 Transcript_59707/m.174596 type:complete len:514 (+) Transcript_59707:152-1693(+)
MEEPQEQSEISKLQLSEKEEEFIGQCWDGIQDSGKLSMDGLGTLCETLGITMDVIDLAITDLGSEDLTMDCDDFMLLMGRMLRSGALTLPQAGITGSGDDGVAAPTDAAADDAVQEPTDPNEISKIELTEREEDFIGQCWDGVKKSDRLDMEGLHALGDTLGIEGEVMNVAVTGLGSADCTMDRGEFMLLMGRLLRSGALKMPAEPDATEEEETAASAPAAKAKAGDSWMAAMAQGGEDDEAAKPAAQAGNMAWMASMAGDADGDEEGDEAKSAKPAAAQAGMAWMATMAVEGEDVDEEEEEETNPRHLYPYRLFSHNTHFGALEMIVGRLRSCTVRCERSGTVLALSKPAFGELRDMFPQFGTFCASAARRRERFRIMSLARLKVGLPLQHFAALRIQQYFRNVLELRGRGTSKHLPHPDELISSAVTVNLHALNKLNSKAVTTEDGGLHRTLANLRSDFGALREELRATGDTELHREVADLRSEFGAFKDELRCLLQVTPPPSPKPLRAEA